MGFCVSRYGETRRNLLSVLVQASRRGMCCFEHSHAQLSVGAQRRCRGRWRCAAQRSVHPPCCSTLRRRGASIVLVSTAAERVIMSSIWSRLTDKRRSNKPDDASGEKSDILGAGTSLDSRADPAPDHLWAQVDQVDSVPDIEEENGPRVDFSNLDRIQAETVAPALGIYATPRGKSGEVDYLFAEEYHEYRHKSWGEQLTFWAGVSYLGGAIIGGSLGFREGIQKGNEMVAELVSPVTGAGGGPKAATSLSVSHVSKAKLRLNALLNAVGRRGGRMGNAAGVLAIMFSGFESFLHWLRDDVDDSWNYIGAGALTGALYKSTAGLRAVSMWSAGLATVGLVGLYGARRGVYGRRLRQLL